jgi:3-oxoacyl-[acyl-carrier-protein] synthase II
MSADPLVVTGAGSVVLTPGEVEACDPRPYLKSSKSRKYMGLQDSLAVVAAARAAASAGLQGELGERCGLYLAVGFIPFEQADIDRLLEGSLEAGRFSMAAFATTGMESVNPLLTFRCLPNMPAYHVSANLGIRGPYLVTYPGPGQLYAALEEAVVALEEGLIDMALLAGVAHQRNFLVRHHLGRLADPVPEERLGDGAGVLVLERARVAARRGAKVLAHLLEWRVAYRSHDPFHDPGRASETFALDGTAWPSPAELGAASLPVAVARAGGRGGVLRHALASRDGIAASSAWELHE